MYSKTTGVHVPSARGTVQVRPDRATVSVLVRATDADAAAVPRVLERAFAALERAVTPATVTPIGYHSSTETPAGKSLFGGSAHTIAEATCRVDLELVGDDGYIARAAALESLRERLQKTDLPDASLTVGQSRFVLADAEAHRAEATAVLHARLRDAATACSMKLERVELETGLSVDVVGPCEAYVSVSGRAHFAVD